MSDLVNPRRPTLKDILAAHPIFDQLLAILAGASWTIWGIGALGLADTQFDSQRAMLYTALGTFCALVLASATFVCTMTYQSTNVLMNAALKQYRPEIRRNWLSILSTALLGAATSVALIAVDAVTPFWSLAIGGYVLAIMLVRGARALYWLNYSLFGDELEPVRRRKITLDGVPMLDRSEPSKS